MMYGCPYQGSKNFIAERIVQILPPSEVFVDLFAGGCAVTHAAMVSGRYTRFVANDFGRMPQVFVDAIHGAASDPKRWLRWVSRERFFEERKKPYLQRDPALMSIWSFGNNCKEYIYGRTIEPWKRALWKARVEGDFSGLEEFGIKTADASLQWMKDHLSDNNDKYIAWLDKCGIVKRDSSDRQMYCLQTLESLQRLQRLQRLQIKCGDYRLVDIPDNATVYCDPPYESTCSKAYQGEKFDNSSFWNWCRTRDFPVFVSEYHAPDDFTVWRKIDTVSRMCANLVKKSHEYVFVHKRFANSLLLKMIQNKTLTKQSGNSCQTV